MYNLSKATTTSHIAEHLEEKEIEYFSLNQDFFDIFEYPVSSKAKIKPNVKFHWYVSSLPCGDCSINDTTRQGAKTWDEFFSWFNGETSDSFSNEQGWFRTKSWRSDSKKEFMSFSLSCSDKLMMKKITGIQGKYLDTLIEPIYLSTITISSPCDTSEQCVNGWNTSKRLSFGNDFNYFESEVILIKEQISENKVKKYDKNSQPSSSFWYYSSLIQKIDPVTGLKCGSRIDNLNIFDKLRTSICKHDWCDLILKYLLLIEACKTGNAYYLLLIRQIQRSLVCHSKHSSLVAVFDWIVLNDKDNWYCKLKQSLETNIRGLRKFRDMKKQIFKEKDISLI